jgi:hypothetical protein
MRKNTILIIVPRGSVTELIMLTSISRMKVVHGRDYIFLAEPNAEMRTWRVDAEVLSDKLGELIEADCREACVHSLLTRLSKLIGGWLMPRRAR